jgi:hypothetical protein
MHHSTTALRAALCSIVLLAGSLFVAAPAKAVAPIGETKTAVILINFSDNVAQPKTKADAHQMVFSTVSDFFWENSYQKTFLSGDTFGWFTLPMVTTCDTDVIANKANEAAAAAGASIGAYQQFIYLFPYNPACGWSGTLRYGPNGEGRTFINDTFTLQNIAHEMGHVFGLIHSDALDCGATTLGSNCTIGGYGDQADTMGNRGAHYNAYQKEKLGWLNAAGMPPITTVTASGRYSISTYETTASGAKALKVLKSTDSTTGFKTWYYVEYRQPIGVDSVLNAVGNLTRGVLVRTGTNATNLSSTSHLLDMTPGSGSTNAADVKDGALEIGRSHVDSDAGVTISLVSADANGAVIDVSLTGGSPAPTCSRSAPAVSLAAASSSANAGGTLSYTLSLTNQDSSACTTTTFSLAKSLPSGWNGTLAAGSLSLSPGATGTTTLSVTSSTSATAGSYAVGVGASSSVGSAHTANASSTYTVTAPAATLTGSVGTDKSSYVRSESVAMSALVKNNGVPVAGANVKFTVTTPGGGSVVINAVSGSDGYARGTYKTGKTKGAVGSYALRADATSGGSTASASTSFSVR